MCETMNPNTPAGCMGEIKFPQNGEAGSGDVIAAPRKRKHPYKQKPPKNILGFDEFVKKQNGGGKQ